MFHLFNKVYLADISEFRSGVPNIILDETYNNEYYNYQSLKSANSLEDLLIRDFNNNLQKFFDYLKEVEGKLFIYLNQQDYEYLQLTLWVSLFRNPTPELLKKLYDMTRDMYRIRYSMFRSEYMGNQSIRNWSRLSLEEIQSMYKNLYVLDLKDAELGIEYSLAYALDKKHPAHQSLLDKLHDFAYTKLYKELVDMKENLVRYGYLLPLIPEFKELTSEPGDLVEGIKRTNQAGLLLDDSFDLKNLNHCQTYYPIEQLLPIYEAVYGQSERFSRSSPLTQALLVKDKEALLSAEIESGIRGVLLNAYDDCRINTYLVSYLYRLIRNKDEGLKQFLLKDGYFG